MNVVLIGMKHGGKTTVGERLAARWSSPFYDVDQMIEVMAECETNQTLSVREIYAQRGQDDFRRIEGMVICDLYMKLDRPGTSAVVSLGGRTALNRSVTDLLSGIGLLVYLEVAPEELWARIQKTGTPSFLDAADPQAQFFELCRERQPLYEQVGELKINLDDLGPEAAVDRVEARIKEHPRGRQ